MTQHKHTKQLDRRRVAADPGGFSLIELMVAVVIVGILAAIAFPSYEGYVLRTKRSEGRGLLMDAAARQERFYSDCNRYGDQYGANNCATDTISVNTTSENNYYTLGVPANLGANNQSFTLTATPVAPFADAECNQLTLTHTGAKGIAGGTGTAANCWGR